MTEPRQRRQRMPLSAAELAEIMEPHCRDCCDFVKYASEQRLVAASALDCEGIKASSGVIASIYKVWPKVTINKNVTAALLLLKAKYQTKWGLKDCFVDDWLDKTTYRLCNMCHIISQALRTTSEDN